MNKDDASASHRHQNLAGQIAIISGGLGDIGAAIALELAGRGVDIAIGDIRPTPEAQALLDGLRRLGRCGRYDRVDVADAAQVTQWVQTVEADLGVPTLIIPNAAVVAVASFCDMTPAQWNRDLRINLDGAFHLAQAGVLRLRAQQQPGRVVFIGSWAAHAPHTYIPAYCASKAGLRMLCQTMALELAEYDILVNEVAPGFVDAGLSGTAWRDHPEKREASLKMVPLRRLILPEEVAAQVAHLCDPANRHMTGATILMDGGLSLTSVTTAPKEK
ncbi:MAG: SDR family oxidoreductase [Phycisphaerales bacterium]|nr:SDR family oxidoreductase [Phycisphaerales bacterium]